MQLIDLSQEIYDGQNSYFRVTVRDFVTYADTALRQQPPAEGGCHRGELQPRRR